LPWLSIQDATVAGHPARLARVSFAGELGWEIHASMAAMSDIYEAVLAGGAKPFGMFALNTMRIEKGYKTWKGDLSSDYSLLEAGLERFVRLGKDQDFPGKAALAAEHQRGSAKAGVALVIEAGSADAPPMSSIWKDGVVVGEATSGAYGYRTDASIALGVVKAEFGAVGTELEVEIFGEMCAAKVVAMPLWDPANDRIRA